MTASTITVEGTLQNDGLTLQLDNKVALSPGRVTVTVQVTAPKTGPGMLEVLDRIHGEQQHRGRCLMTEEEMATEITALRAEDEEYEERCRQIWSQTRTPPRTTEAP